MDASAPSLCWAALDSLNASPAKLASPGGAPEGGGSRRIRLGGAGGSWLSRMSGRVPAKLAGRAARAWDSRRSPQWTRVGPHRRHGMGKGAAARHRHPSPSRLPGVPKKWLRRGYVLRKFQGISSKCRSKLSQTSHYGLTASMVAEMR